MIDPRAEYQFFLVQRLTAQAWVSERNTGFDRQFSIDYMGSAEFEFGSVPDSLKRIRSSDSLIIRPYELEIDGVKRTVYLVGDAATLDVKFRDMIAWTRGPRPFRGQERSYFPEVFSGKADDYYLRTVAWWSLKDDVAWALDEENAQKLLTGFLSKPAK